MRVYIPSIVDLEDTGNLLIEDIVAADIKQVLLRVASIQNGTTRRLKPGFWAFPVILLNHFEHFIIRVGYWHSFGSMLVQALRKEF